MTDQTLPQSDGGNRPDPVVRTALVWRRRDKAAIADRANPDAKRAEYHARQQLREAVDNLDAKAGKP